MTPKKISYGNKATFSKKSYDNMAAPSKISNENKVALRKRSTMEQYLRKCCNSGCSTADIRTLVYSGTFC